MATLQAVHQDISKFFATHFSRSYAAEQERAASSRFAKSPSIRTMSPLDKPLPLLPTPVTAEVPIIKTPTPGKQKQKPFQYTTPVLVGPVEPSRQEDYDPFVSNNWIDMLFADNEISFGAEDSGYAWQLGKKMLERACLDSDQPYATAVYECAQVKGRVRGPKAYMKIYMQIPGINDSYNHTYTKAAPVPKQIVNEITALKRTCQVEGDVAAPRLLATKSKTQTQQMWVPGGFLTFIVMQRLPGTILDSRTFWRLPAMARDDIRTSFRSTLENLWQAGVVPRSCSIDKIAWNHNTGKCYIMDLEAAETVDHPLCWWDHEYYKWGLSKSTHESGEILIYDDINTPLEIVNNQIREGIDRAVVRNKYPDSQLHTVRFILAGPGG